MPRRSSSGRSSRPAPRPAAARNPPLQPVHRAPPPAPAQSGSGGSIGSIIGQGIAFGTGSAIAHRAVDAVMGPRTVEHETVATEGAATAPAPTANSLGSDACGVHTKAFQDCLNSYGNDISRCQFYMDMLAECKKNSGASLSA
ncbi:hypothetical protein K1719_018569 [Acacia pycnantha]|nr:hypothetical protein K1719_018569 [Acacia pycnantha]